MALVAGGVVIVTLVGAVVGTIAPSVAPGDGPRPTLHGTVDDAASILVNNLRQLALPLLLAVGGWWTCGRSRMIGDAIVGALVLVNAFVVGSAIGAYRASIVPYLPHLPLEWAALSVAAGGWIAHRGRAGTWRSLRSFVLATIVLAVAAAVVETVAVPHA